MAVRFAAKALAGIGLIAMVVSALQLRWIELPAGLTSAASSVTPTKSQTAQATPVEVAQAVESIASSDISAIGSLQSDESVQLAPEVAGRIAEIHFDEGQPVIAGDVLVRLDKTLARASEEEMRVRLDLAKTNYERAQRMAGSGSGTGRDVDVALAERNTAAALLNSQQAQLAKLDIVAPFDGVVGLRRVSVGSYVGVGVALVNLEKIDTLKVDFKIPEANLQKVAIGQDVEIAVDAVPGHQFIGRIYAIDPMADVNGRAISIRAKLANDERLLRPGLFARIIVKGLEQRKIITVPESAVIARGQARYVWVIADGKAREAKVTVGARKAGAAELEGISKGDMVVTAGHTRLRNGAPVEVVESQVPEPAI